MTGISTHSPVLEVRVRMIPAFRSTAFHFKQQAFPLRRAVWQATCKGPRNTGSLRAASKMRVTSPAVKGSRCTVSSLRDLALRRNWV